MKIAALATAVVVAGLLVTPTALAQEGGVLELRVESIDAESHPEVTMIVSVPRDLVGKDLSAEAFTVSDGGESVISSVARLPADEIEVVLVLDLSESMTGAPLTAAKEAIREFTDQMPTGVRMAVVGFNGAPVLVSEFTDDAATTTAALNGLFAAGETALYDGLVTAAGLFDPAIEARRSIVVLSDGGDTVSTAGLEDAIVSVLASNAAFYAVELQSPELDPEPLQRLGAATDGTVVSAGDPEAFAGIYEEIASALVNQYAIAFTTSQFGLTELGVTVADGPVAAAATQAVQFPTEPVAPVAPPEPAREPVVEPPTFEPPEPVAAPPPSGLARGPALYVGLGALFIAILGLALLAFTHEGGAPARFRVSFGSGAAGGKKALTGITNKATLFAERALDSRGQQGGLSFALERAGIALRTGEFLVLVGSAALVALAVGTLFSSLVLGIALAAATPLLARFLLKAKASSRANAFGEQLGDNLQLIAGGLQAGHGLLQSIDAVAAEALSPSAEEFRRVVVESHLGRDLGEALRAMADRIGGEDFRWVVDAIEIHRDVGGDLAEILQTVAETIRDRGQIRRRVKTLSAEGRLSGIVLMILPVAVAILVSITNPTYLAELTGSTVGQIMIAFGLGFMVLGALWIRRIVKIKF
jgi:tight adherence protein B